MKKLYFPILFIIFLASWSCSSGGDKNGPSGQAEPVLIKDGFGYPSVAYRDGIYYLTGQGADIRIYKSADIDSLGSAPPVTVWEGPANGMHNIWAPFLMNMDGKWYVYFEADDGLNTDDHELYVIENPSADPTEGEWTLHGPIITGADWNFGIHPSSFIIGGKQYLLWSGWENRRTETETQCLFIAEMENPWTLRSPRVMISRPEKEWERQWINPDGTRSAYPIFVNENPEAIVSPDGKKVSIVYSASGIWTLYATLGMLTADAGSNLLDPASWTKSEEPLRLQKGEEPMTSISNISTLQTSDGKNLLFYQERDDTGGSKVYVKEFGWNPDGTPSLGL